MRRSMKQSIIGFHKDERKSKLEIELNCKKCERNEYSSGRGFWYNY